MRLFVVLYILAILAGFAAIVTLCGYALFILAGVAFPNPPFVFGCVYLVLLIAYRSDS